jgi:hypothetical protein
MQQDLFLLYFAAAPLVGPQVLPASATFKGPGFQKNW